MHCSRRSLTTGRLSLAQHLLPELPSSPMPGATLPRTNWHPQPPLTIDTSILSSALYKLFLRFILFSFSLCQKRRFCPLFSLKKRLKRFNATDLPPYG